jgi:sterol desaturase/sphingolipid hydroxylase (fatty acid hydroxylase superfamily)
MRLFRSLSWTGVGLAVTPLLEYAWHAWIAHGKRPDPTREAHLEHHRTACMVQDPWEEMRENAPLIGRTLLGVNLALAPFLGLSRTLPLSAGLVAGYAFTTLYHAEMHLRGPRSAYERWMWRFHWHHHASDARDNFGLTNPVFDFVFRTATVPETVEVPSRLAPEWLRDVGEVPGLRIRMPEAHAS